MLFSCIFTDII